MDHTRKKKQVLSACTPWRRIGKEEVQLLSFFTSALDGRDWSKSCIGYLSPEMTPRVHTNETGGWVGL